MDPETYAESYQAYIMFLFDDVPLLKPVNYFRKKKNFHFHQSFQLLNNSQYFVNPFFVNPVLFGKWIYPIFFSDKIQMLFSREKFLCSKFLCQAVTIRIIFYR